MKNQNEFEFSPTMPRGKPRSILVVEDDRTMLMFLEQQLQGLGYETTGVGDGETACDTLERRPDSADVIVLDRTLPGMQGLDVVRRLRSDSRLRGKPIVMLTACDEPDQIKEGVDAGIFYYLVKPVASSVLQSVMSAAMKRAETNQLFLHEINARKSGMSCVKSAKFQIQSLSEADDIAALISGCFPEPDRAVFGISELLTNAIEHGNLEIGFDMKGELLERDAWHKEIERRAQMPEYANRVVDVAVKKEDTGTYIVITDDGPGFNPRQYLTLDPSRAGKKHGRGIAQARVASFDKLGYNERGNQVVGFVAIDRQLSW